MDAIKNFIKQVRIFLTNDIYNINSLKEDNHQRDQLINQLCEITKLSFYDIYQYSEDISLMIVTNDRSTIQLKQLTSLIIDSFVRNEMIETIQSKNNI